MTSFSHLFHTYTPCSGHKKVRIADGSYSPIVGNSLINLSKPSLLKMFSIFLNLPVIYYQLVNYLETLTVVLFFSKYHCVF